MIIMIGRRLVLALLLLIGTGSKFGVQSYVNSPHALPLSRQMLYLEELTSDVVSARPGALSNLQIAASHTLLHAWSHTEQRRTDEKCEAALKVEALIKRLVDERRAGNAAATIDTADYNCVLGGWARCGNEASARRAESVLEAMQQHGPPPNLDSYKAALMAWWNCRHLPYAPQRAQRILDQMLNAVPLSKKNNNNNPRSSSDGSISSLQQVVPDSDCFDICLLLHSANGDPRSAERLLGTMANFAPPRISSFNAVLRAWFNSKNHEEAADRMQTILDFMESQPQLHPDKSTYRTVMNTFLHLPNHQVALERSEGLLRHVLDSGKATTGDLDRILFNGPMGLWSKSMHPQAYRRARWILDQQLQHHLMPDVVGLTAVLGACKSSKDPQAVKVGMSTYELFQTLGVKPNYISFATMMNICGNIKGDDEYRTKSIKRIFQDATSSGHFSDKVHSRLKAVASHALYNELLGNHVDDSKMPLEWSANIHEQSQHDRARRKRAEV
jgi:Pentatricopeptide repeat domain